MHKQTAAETIFYLPFCTALSQTMYITKISPPKLIYSLLLGPIDIQEGAVQLGQTSRFLLRVTTSNSVQGSNQTPRVQEKKNKKTKSLR